MKTVTSITLAATIAACASSIEMQEPEPAQPMLEAWLAGDFGPRAGFDGRATSVSRVDDPERAASALVTALDEGDRVAVTIIDTRDFLLSDFAAGEHEFVVAAGSVAPPPMTVAVCSGEPGAPVDFDRQASRAILRIEDGPSARLYSVSTEMPAFSGSGVDVTVTSWSEAR